MRDFFEYSESEFVAFNNYLQFSQVIGGIGACVSVVCGVVSV